MPNLKRKRGSERSSMVKNAAPDNEQSDDNFSAGSFHKNDVADEQSDISVDNDDADEWQGIDDEHAVNRGPINDGRTSNSLSRPPAGEELRVIKDATELFRSGSFKLQVDALLPNVRPKASRIPPLEHFLLDLHTFLKSLPPIASQHPLQAARKLLKSHVSVPYVIPLPSEETNWKVAFEPPSDITLVGSWANKVSVKSKDGLKFGVDLAVEMPNDIFQEKDYLNGRFFQKKAFYIATIAAAIQSSTSPLNVDVCYESHRGDPRLTKLVLSPRKDDSPNDFTKLYAQVCIIPVMSTSSPIALQKLSPSHSNIRISSNSPEGEMSVRQPTPMYNTAILLSLSPRSNLLASYTLKQEAPSFSDAVTLLRVWANQRGYCEGSRMCIHGFDGSGPWWSALLEMLILGEEPLPGALKGSKRRPLGKGLSSYQLFKTALDFLAKHDFTSSPIYLKTKAGHKFPPAEYKENHQAIFIDSSSLSNLLVGVPVGSLELLRHDASETLELLNKSSLSSDPFSEVFLIDHRDLPTRFDTLLRVDLSSMQPRKSSVEQTMDWGSAANAVMASLCDMVRRGLGDRARAVVVLHPSIPSRSLSQAHPSNSTIIFIGMIHNHENAFRLVDHGPAADEQDETLKTAFREFWGDKAELRRFKDGRILESVVWDVKTSDERAHIPAMVVRYVLQRHFAIGDGFIQTWQNPFDSLLRLPESVSSIYLETEIPVSFKGAISAYDQLVKSIKALGDKLPLSLLNISPISDSLRYTSTFSPVPIPESLAPIIPPGARYLSPFGIILEFEKSSKWPDDIRAIQKIKLAFFERIAAEFMDTIPNLKANVVLGGSVRESDMQDTASLEIITPEGWAFSAYIWNEREAVLLQRIIDGNNNNLPHIISKANNVKQGKEYQEALNAMEVYTRRFIHAPRHHRAIAALCHRYSAFAGTVRLTKRWLASHWLLQGHIREEVVELICAKFFAGDEVESITDLDQDQKSLVSAPGSKERGFACVVRFLKDWKWMDGLFVPLYGSGAGVHDDQAKSNVKINGPGVWMISTEFDSDGKIWTSHGPDNVVAHRIRTLAGATWRCLQKLELGRLDVMTMFIHPTQDYDVLIQLDANALPRYAQNVRVDSNVLLNRRGVYANLPENVVVTPSFDPAYLLYKDLQRIYSDTFKIFFDPYGGDQFGIVWDPTLKQTRPFRVLGGFSSMPVDTDDSRSKDKGAVILNEVAVLTEVERLGTGLIKAITIRG